MLAILYNAMASNCCWLTLDSEKQIYLLAMSTVVTGKGEDNVMVPYHPEQGRDFYTNELLSSHVVTEQTKGIANVGG